MYIFRCIQYNGNSLHGLQAEEIIDKEEIANVRSAYKSHLESELSKVSTYAPTASMLEDQWKGIVWPASAEANHDPETGVDHDTLTRVGEASVAVPDGFVSYIPVF